MIKTILLMSVIATGSGMFIQYINMILFTTYMRGKRHPNDQSPHIIGSIIYNIGIYTIAFSLCLCIYLLSINREALGVFILIFGSAIAFPLTDILIKFVVFVQYRILKPVYQPICVAYTKETKRFLLLEEYGFAFYCVFLYDYTILPNVIFLILSFIGLTMTIISIKRVFVD